MSVDRNCIVMLLALCALGMCYVCGVSHEAVLLAQNERVEQPVGRGATIAVYVSGHFGRTASWTFSMNAIGQAAVIVRGRGVSDRIVFDIPISRQREFLSTLEEVGFFDLPREVGNGPPDAVTITITAADGVDGNSVVVYGIDPEADAESQRRAAVLIEFAARVRRLFDSDIAAKVGAGV